MHLKNCLSLQLSKEKEALKVSEDDKRHAEDIILKQYNEYERVISDLDSQVSRSIPCLEQPHWANILLDKVLTSSDRS